MVEVFFAADFLAVFFFAAILPSGLRVFVVLRGDEAADAIDAYLEWQSTGLRGEWCTSNVARRAEAVALCADAYSPRAEEARCPPPEFSPP